MGLEVRDAPLTLAVRADLGVSSLEEIVHRRLPIRVATGVLDGQDTTGFLFAELMVAGWNRQSPNLRPEASGAFGNLEADPVIQWTELGIPLHTGAERFYREMGYMPCAVQDLHRHKRLQFLIFVGRPIIQPLV